ncbi:hypothetical protein SBA3_2550014 [Candidatus Sulfopaludibacter sp. SbA3]|nr:hypothetical protein SBA3_2550014 [Candidatus Sulfopaludibacter sp. SbA3]
MRLALLREVAHHLEGVGDAGDIMVRGFNNPRKHPITQYAGDGGWREYFAESLVAFLVDADVLALYDANGSTMVRKVLRSTWK